MTEQATSSASTQVPGTFVAPTATDVGGPAATLLRQWQLLPADSSDKVGALTGTPDSVAIIKTGMSSAAKWWSTAGVGAATITALLAQFKALPDILQQSVGVGLPVFSSAVVLGVAFIVANDVRGRAEATNQQLRSRADVLQAYLALLAATHAPAVVLPPAAAGTAATTTSPTDDERHRALLVALAAAGTGRLTASGDGSAGSLGALRQLDGRPAQVQVDGDWVDLTDVSTFQPTTD